MEIAYRPSFDSEFESLIERIHPPRVCIDNETFPDCTLVKVDSANKHGILLEMVQVLTDLDLVISKSYICSDGGWLMDVFHVTDQFGNKVIDQSLLYYIQQAMCTSRRRGLTTETPTTTGREVRPRHLSTDQMVLEMTGTDRPGVMSEISAVLAEMGCSVSTAVVWTHNSRAACIFYVEDEYSREGPVMDPCRIAQMQAQLENVVEAHHCNGERRSVRLTAPVAGQTHTERRLHQLMADDKDYEECCCSCNGGEALSIGRRKERRCGGTHVTVENCDEKGYSIVTVRSRDRPKLLFDTVCTLTDMEYVVFHAAISCKASLAIQEYYIRHKDGWILDSDSERRRVAKCLIAATERRVSHGLRLDVYTRNRLGLLSDITRVLRENGLSITRAEVGSRGERAVGSFYVTDVSGNSATPETVDLVRNEISSAVEVEVVVAAVDNSPSRYTSLSSSSSSTSRNNNNNNNAAGDGQDRPRFSLGSLLWSQLERLSSNFRPIKS